MAVAICIPILNERDTITKLLSDVTRELSTIDHHICIVDDGSTDGTREVVRALAAHHRNMFLLEREKKAPGCQRGAATRAGLELLLSNRSNTVFVDLDGDGSQRPEELHQGIGLVQSGFCDVAIASKYVPGAVVSGRPLLRRAGSWAYNYALRLLMNHSIQDYSNSYRFYSRKAAEALFHFPPSYTTPVYLIEMMAIWLSNGYRIVEFPTKYAPRGGGTSKVSIGDAWRGFAGAFDVAFRFRCGAYVIRDS